jgi:hypothetical protein
MKSWSRDAGDVESGFDDVGIRRHPTRVCLCVCVYLRDAQQSRFLQGREFGVRHVTSQNWLSQCGPWEASSRKWLDLLYYYMCG